MSGLVSDFNIPDHVSEADDDVKSEPGLVDSESEDEDGNPRRGHVRRRVETIEASVMIHDSHQRNMTTPPRPRFFRRRCVFMYFYCVNSTHV